MTEIEQSCAPGLDFDTLVAQHYRALYQFAFSLTRCEADACDLTQQTFYAWASKGGQLRDLSKVKTWLFTTLHRAFLQIRRKQARFPHYELSEVAPELPSTYPARSDQSDLDSVVAALAKVEKTYRAPVALFYLEERPYKEIAQILGVPMGTVKSRISRGIAQLHNLLTGGVKTRSGKGEHVNHARPAKRLDRSEPALPWQPALG